MGPDILSVHHGLAAYNTFLWQNARLLFLFLPQGGRKVVRDPDL